MQDELFKTVAIGGYDKEEVLTFIKEKLTKIEENYKVDKDLITSKDAAIENLSANIKDLEEKLATSYVENQRLSDIISHQDKINSNKYSSEQITSLLHQAKQVSDKMVNEANKKADIILKAAKSKAFQEIRFKTDADKKLQEYENKYLNLSKNIFKLKTITEKLFDNLSLIKEDLNNIDEDLARAISDINEQ